MNGKVAIPSLFRPSKNGGILFHFIRNGVPLDTLEFVIQRIATQIDSRALFVAGQVFKGLGVIGNTFAIVPGYSRRVEKGE